MRTHTFPAEQPDVLLDLLKKRDDIGKCTFGFDLELYKFIDNRRNGAAVLLTFSLFDLCINRKRLYPAKYFVPVPEKRGDY